ncbi:MAG: diphosphomevalonate decarboxylase [Chloroflexi bacterium]|nr:diphosphomevalonate decarboxylase [Chloroflexota bacterium]
MRRASAIAHPNLAFVKYWGKANSELNIPFNGSISMNLSSAKTVTTITFDEGYDQDHITIDGETLHHQAKAGLRISQHLDRLREIAHTSTFAQVITRNNFPMGTGFASSASGFAALTLAAASALGLELSKKQLSILARRGSGSACRSIPDGFAEWFAGHDNESSYAIEIAPVGHWDIIDIAVVVSNKAKLVSSSLGHELAQNSPFWAARSQIVSGRLARVRAAIEKRDFSAFGHEIESEALELHAIAMTSSYNLEASWQSGIFYWEPSTLHLLKLVQEWRATGLEVYFTLDAGPTVHIICRQQQEIEVLQRISGFASDLNWNMVVSKPASGSRIISDTDLEAETKN